MKLEYGDQTLGDDSAGDFILAQGGPHQRLVQQDPLVQDAGAPLTQPRGNYSNQLSYAVSKQHASAAAAKAWFHRHPDELPAAGELRITEGTDADSMADAVLQNVERVELTGRSTVMRYTFTGGQILQAA